MYAEVGEEKSFTGFFRIKHFLDVKLNEFRVYLDIDLVELQKPNGDPIKWEESIFNAADGNYADMKAIAEAPAIEVYKWFLLNSKRNQRREDQRAVMEYEARVEQFQPRN